MAVFKTSGVALAGRARDLNTIVPTLEKHGRKAPWPMMPSEFDRQIKEYEALCIEKGLPMTGWNRINRLKNAVAIGLIAWISLMIVFSLVGKS